MTADRPATEPRTEAGRRMLHRRSYWSGNNAIRDAILAIEAEAAQGAAPRAEGLDVERLVADIEAIDHPCHDVCIGNLHADCQCAAWIRQEVLLLLSRPSDERVPESEASDE